MLKPRADWCDLGEVVEGAIADLTPLIGKHHVIRTVPTDLPQIVADEVLVRQAIFNILQNCVAYTPDDARISLTASYDSAEVTLTIEDNGHGFESEVLPRIFDKFFRGPNPGAPGTGLGLSIARGFIEANKGTLVAANRAQGGARFVITLPAAKPPPEA